MKNTVAMFQRYARRIGKPAFYYLSHPGAAFRRERVVTSEDGIRFWSRHENLIERTIAEDGVWERAETEAVRRFIEPGKTCLDVGANIGYFALLMAKLGGRVLAFEPTTYGYDRLSANLLLNPNYAARVTAIKCALGDEAAMRSVALEARFSMRKLAHDEVEPVHFDTMDGWCGRQGLDRIDFLKIDVDGFDLAVVRGGVETIRYHRPIIMAEFCERVLRPQGVTVKQYADTMIAYGYDRCEILGSNASTTLRQFASEPHGLESSLNLLLYPN